jgi:hypothetical protein
MAQCFLWQHLKDAATGECESLPVSGGTANQLQVEAQSDTVSCRIRGVGLVTGTEPESPGSAWHWPRQFKLNFESASLRQIMPDSECAEPNTACHCH